MTVSMLLHGGETRVKRKNHVDKILAIKIMFLRNIKKYEFDLWSSTIFTYETMEH
jgi:hypothetical protein